MSKTTGRWFASAGQRAKFAKGRHMPKEKDKCLTGFTKVLSLLRHLNSKVHARTGLLEQKTSEYLTYILQWK